MATVKFCCRLTQYFMVSAVLIALLTNKPTTCNGASSYSLTVKKYVCIDTPYKESTLYVCKNIPRRNAPTMIQVLIHVPKLYDIILVKVSLFYKFSTYQPFLITVNRDACESIRNPPQFGIEKHVYDIVQETVPELLASCPSGNRTYNITWYLQDRHAPKNIPAGDYKLQVKLQALPDVTVFGMDVYCSVRSTGIVSKFMLQ